MSARFGPENVGQTIRLTVDVLVAPEWSVDGCRAATFAGIVHDALGANETVTKTCVSYIDDMRLNPVRSERAKEGQQ